MSPMMGVMRFMRWRKLIPKYVGHFEILWNVDEATYDLVLPPILLDTLLVFHVLILYRYVPDESHVL